MYLSTDPSVLLVLSLWRARQIHVLRAVQPDQWGTGGCREAR